MNIKDLEITDFCPFCQSKLKSATTDEFHCNKCRKYRTVLGYFVEIESQSVFAYISYTSTTLYKPLNRITYTELDLDDGFNISNLFVEKASNIHDVLKLANKIWDLKTLA